LCLSKYISVFVSTYAGPCRDRRRHARRHLNLSLYLYLFLYLYLEPLAALFQKPSQKPFEKPFASLSAALTFGFCLLPFDFVLPPVLPPGQSPVCHPHGRIAVPAASDHYISIVRFSLPHVRNRLPWRRGFHSSKSFAIPRNCSSAASRLSAISVASTSGSGRLSVSSRLSSLSQKMSRLALSRATRSS
jgi:hypothetical protein